MKDICATPECERVARFMSIPEGNTLGNDAPWRCAVCCDAIGDAFYTYFVIGKREAVSR